MISQAAEGLIRAVLRVLLAQIPANEHADADADLEYAESMVCLAARDLVDAVNALPPDERPVGWVA